MVTRSPLSASVSSVASGDGERRSGADASPISRTCPSTKRAASNLPARYLAARSGRAGVMRGSYAVISGLDHFQFELVLIPPFVPAKAGTQGRLHRLLSLGPRFRGDERLRCGDSTSSDHVLS